MIAPAADPGAKNGDKETVRPNPFVRASTEHVETFADDSRVMSSTGGTAVGPLDVISFGFLRHVAVRVEATGGAGGANTVAGHEDSPWRALQDVSLMDVNSYPIVGPMDGYDLYLANLFGAYSFMTNYADAPTFGAVAAGAGASGNFSFFFRFPVEITGRDALGALENQNAATAYKTAFTVAASTRVYTTAPATTLPTVRVRQAIESWTLPPPADLRGVPNVQTPPNLGTTQFWSKQVYNVNAGDQTISLKRVGNLIRTLILIFRRTDTGLRSTVDMPDPLSIEWNGKVLIRQWRDHLRQLTWERFGIVPPTGVLVLDFTHDLDYRAGNEMHDLYLPTTEATRLELRGNWGAAGSLTVLTNDVAPTGVIYAQGA